MLKNIRGAWPLVCILFVCTACTKGADEVQIGMKAYEQRDYARALQIFERNQSNPSAETYLARMYQYGLGVVKDAPKAATLYRDAADKGSRDAASAYGRMLVYGFQIPKNGELGLKYLETAGAEGDLQAYVDAGDYYLSLNTSASSLLALLEYEKGGASVVAQTAISRLYEAGAPGIPENPKLAREALESAIAHPGEQERSSINDAIVNLAELYFLGYGVEKSTEKAIALLESTGDKRYGESMKYWFMDFESGHPMSREAIQVWLKDVRDHPNGNHFAAATDYARIGLAVAYANGFTVEKSQAQSDFYLARDSVSYFGGKYLLSMFRSKRLLPGGCNEGSRVNELPSRPAGRYRTSQAYAYLTKAMCQADASQFLDAYSNAQMAAQLGYPGATDYAQLLRTRLKPADKRFADIIEPLTQLQGK
jgi:hypothetical protein